MGMPRSESDSRSLCSSSILVGGYCICKAGSARYRAINLSTSAYPRRRILSTGRSRSGKESSQLFMRTSEKISALLLMQNSDYNIDRNLSLSFKLVRSCDFRRPQFVNSRLLKKLLQTRKRAQFETDACAGKNVCKILSVLRRQLA